MSAYVCVRHADAAGFLKRAGDWLLRAEAENNLIIGIANQLIATPNTDAFLATLEHDGEVVGCAFRTPPYKLGVTRMPTGAAHALAEAALTIFDDTPSVLGPEAVATVVADALASARGKTVHLGLHQRIYELRIVVPPTPTPSGKLRLAQPGDYDVLVQWLERFAAETDHGAGDVRSYTATHIRNKTVFIWDDDGPRTTALWAGLTPNGVRIGFVYTPPAWRGRGYASACTAGASQRALDSGYTFCCLYTDLGNPVSNSIYQKIGYRPIADVVDCNIT